MSLRDLIVVSIGLGTGTPNLELGEMALKRENFYRRSDKINAIKLLFHMIQNKTFN